MPATKLTKQQEKYILKVYKNGSGKFARKIASEFKVGHQVITNCLKRNGITPKKRWPGPIGEQNARWNGGRRMVKGYLHILKPEHRLARADGYVAEHRLLKESEIIKKEQVVHHKDENRLNNKLANLEVYPNNGEHRKYHSISQSRDIKGKFIINTKG